MLNTPSHLYHNQYGYEDNLQWATDKAGTYETLPASSEDAVDADVLNEQWGKQQTQGHVEYCVTNHTRDVSGTPSTHDVNANTGQASSCQHKKAVNVTRCLDDPRVSISDK